MAANTQAAVATAPRIIPERRDKSPVHVLVIDDERLMRWAVTQTLGARGYDVCEAIDAETAMRAVADGTRRIAVSTPLEAYDQSDAQTPSSRPGRRRMKTAQVTRQHTT